MKEFDDLAIQVASSRPDGSIHCTGYVEGYHFELSIHGQRVTVGRDIFKRLIGEGRIDGGGKPLEQMEKSGDEK